MTDQIPPASDDGFVQDFLESHWRDAIRLTAEATGMLREIWPEFSQTMPETGSHAIHRALEDFESAHANLHRAGRHVLGQEAYDRFLETAAQKKVG